jgi:RNA polymerase sigma-54 factor
MKLSQSHFLSQKQIQKQILSQKQIDAITILQTNRLELNNLLQEEMEWNPFLEVEDANSPEGESGEKDTGEEIREEERDISSPVDLDIDWTNVFDTGSYTPSTSRQDEEKDSFETYTSKSETLYEHLIKQFHLIASDEQEIQVGEFLIGCLDVNGYLRKEDVKAAAQEFKVEEEFVDGVREKLLSLSPPGVGAISVKEALIAQLESRDDISKEDKSQLISLLEDYSDYLIMNKIVELSKLTGLSVERIYSLLKILKTLTLYPASQYTDNDNFYVVPDVVIKKKDGKYYPEWVDKGVPKVRLNKKYYSLLEKKDKMDPEQYAFLKSSYESAKNWIKSLEDRKSTTLRVAEVIVDKQQDFFERGPKYLKPLRQKDVAEELGLSEATISRVTKNRYMETPQGILEFKYFFSTHIPKSSWNEDDVSAKAIQERIKELIASEDKKKPLSDDKITKILTEEGFKIKRRTVQKYRQLMGIPSSIQRKRY